VDWWRYTHAGMGQHMHCFLGTLPRAHTCTYTRYFPGTYDQLFFLSDPSGPETGVYCFLLGAPARRGSKKPGFLRSGGGTRMVNGCHTTSVGPPKFVGCGGNLSVGNGFCRLDQNFPTDNRKKLKFSSQKNSTRGQKILFFSKTERFWLKIVGWAQILSVGPNFSTNNIFCDFFFSGGLSRSQLFVFLLPSFLIRGVNPNHERERERVAFGGLSPYAVVVR